MGSQVGKYIDYQRPKKFFEGGTGGQVPEEPVRAKMPNAKLSPPLPGFARPKNAKFSGKGGGDKNRKMPNAKFQPKITYLTIFYAKYGHFWGKFGKK